MRRRQGTGQGRATRRSRRAMQLLAVEELSATAEALDLALRRLAIPSLRLGLETLRDAERATRAIRDASRELSRQLESGDLSGLAERERCCDGCVPSRGRRTR